jgi:hypothetical protein
MFSMRSHVDGKYSILKDGNFQLTMSRVMASDISIITVSVPRESSDYRDLLNRYSGWASKDSGLSFTKMDYGFNAVDTRLTFWEVNAKFMKAAENEYDVLITDITGYEGPLPVIYNFNITKLPELNRPYIDKFFEQDLDSISKSLFTTVLNPRQREYILEVRPDLIDKIFVNTKCLNKRLTELTFTELWPDPVIFWPFRISDTSYKWEEFLKAFQEQGLHKKYDIVITDPNDSIKDLPSFVSKIKPTKDEYNRILMSRPKVVMLDDIDTVLHPGTIEFFYHRCPVITYHSELISNPNAISDLKELSTAIENLSYNRPNIVRFVYQHSEFDILYNQDFINVKKN